VPPRPWPIGGRWARLEGAEPSGGGRTHYDEEDGRAEDIMRGRRKQTTMLNHARMKKGPQCSIVRGGKRVVRSIGRDWWREVAKNLSTLRRCFSYFTAAAVSGPLIRAKNFGPPAR
jgi:hypothetical protein